MPSHQKTTFHILMFCVIFDFPKLQCFPPIQNPHFPFMVHMRSHFIVHYVSGDVFKSMKSVHLWAQGRSSSSSCGLRTTASTSGSGRPSPPSHGTPTRFPGRHFAPQKLRSAHIIIARVISVNTRVDGCGIIRNCVLGVSEGAGQSVLGVDKMCSPPSLSFRRVVCDNGSVHLWIKIKIPLKVRDLVNGRLRSNNLCTLLFLCVSVHFYATVYGYVIGVGEHFSDIRV